MMADRTRIGSGRCVVRIVRRQPGRIERAAVRNGRVLDVRLDDRICAARSQILIGGDEGVVDTRIATQSGDGQLRQRDDEQG